MYLNDKLPQGEAETKVDPYTLPALIAWLRTKPADRTYCYFDNGHCLIGQYLRFLGVKEPSVSVHCWRVSGTHLYHPLPRVFDQVSIEFPYTFGAALARAEALARELP